MSTTDVKKQDTSSCKDEMNGEIPDICSGDNDSGVCTKSDGLMNGVHDDDDGDMDDSLDLSVANELEMTQEQEDKSAEYEDITEPSKDKRKRAQKRSAKARRKKKKTMEFQTKFPLCEVGETVPVYVYCTFSKATVMWQVYIFYYPSVVIFYYFH